MQAVTICVWGRNGCGKTTLALNLAAWLAQNQMLVGLVSSADYAEIPAYLGLSFPLGKGVKAAKDDPNTPIKEFYVNAEQNDSSLYLLSPAPHGSFLDVCGLDRQFGRRVVLESKETFDALIIDGSAAKENAISGEGLALANAVIIPVDDNAAYPEWYHSNARIFDNIKQKTVFVESKDNSNVNMQSILKEMGVTALTSLPYIRSAANDTYEGRFLFRGGREQKNYEMALSVIWEAAGGAVE